MLADIFRTVGEVTNAKIIPDRNYSHGGLNYGFVDFSDHKVADTALQTLNGRKIFGHEIKVNWAYQGTSNAQKEDTSNHFHIFVGDLSPEVNDQVLGKAFSAFSSMSDARVMWDQSTSKSRGYGFVAFREKADAEQAIATMNGEWLGSRSIRVNWANQKNQGAAGGSSSSGSVTTQPLSYDIVVSQTPYTNTVVYVGNINPGTQQTDLHPLFQPYGFVMEVRIQSDRGFAFVKMDTHEHAAMAICYLNGANVNGRQIKCSWGKDRNQQTTGASPVTPGPDPNMMAMYQQAYSGYGGQQYGDSTQANGNTDNGIPPLPGFDQYGNYDYTAYYQYYVWYQQQLALQAASSENSRADSGEKSEIEGTNAIDIST
ncbi:hypothetical protein BKA69DRAFT_1120342 [Paraphysoderma sedebokerense]|nr:hypothetical protein BKA69DRAFT_1120342 [Paraphysoderma sedebokerense]